jgi:hypothetical protein
MSFSGEQIWIKMFDWYISKTMPVKPRFPAPPQDLSEESGIQWCREMGRYLAQSGYGKKAIAQLGRGQSPLSKQALKEGFRNE